MENEVKLEAQVKRILREDYPFLFDKRVQKFIQFLQETYNVKPDGNTSGRGE